MAPEKLFSSTKMSHMLVVRAYHSPRNKNPGTDIANCSSLQSLNSQASPAIVM